MPARNFPICKTYGTARFQALKPGVRLRDPPGGKNCLHTTIGFPNLKPVAKRYWSPEEEV
jgi:hypothetical protein